LPQPVQSPSFTAVQLGGQHPSPVTHVPIVPPSTHRRWHAVPCKTRIVHATFEQSVGQLSCSQNSPGSMTPLPHTAVQLLSLLALHPAGQHASSLTHVVCVPDTWHTARHVPPLASARKEQPCGAHDIGHDESGSHVSPTSMTPLPHVAGQSASRFAGDVLHPGGQHPSIAAPLHGSCVVEQRALQVAGDPV
jgi:hypothetical protein